MRVSISRGFLNKNIIIVIPIMAAAVVVIEFAVVYGVFIALATKIYSI